MKRLAAVIFSSLLSITVALEKLQVLYEWKYVDLDWSSPEEKNSYTEDKSYMPEKIILYDVEVTTDKRFFVTAVRDEGVPASLFEVTDKMGDGGPLLRPYPSFEYYDKDFDCQSIISVYRVAIDPCNRLWVLDTGKVGNTKYCSPKVLIFDLTKDELIGQLDIPDDVAEGKNGKGLLVTPIIQTEDSKCRKQTIYLADCEGYGIVVSNSMTSKGVWRVDDYTFKPSPISENITIAGDSFTIQDGVLGMALSSPILTNRQKNTRVLYYSQLASFNIMYGYTDQLQDPNRHNVILRNAISQSLPSQTSSMVMYNDEIYDILFFSQLQNTSINCAIRSESFVLSNFDVVDMDETALQFPSGMKIRNTGYLDAFYTLTNRYQKVATNSLNIEETNFRILTAAVDDLIYGTACDQDISN